MIAREKAARAARLRADDAFIGLVQEVRDAAVAVFLDAASTPEAREDAHLEVRAMARIEARLLAAENDWVIEQKRSAP